MYIAFAELPKTARLWIYQSNRTITSEENEAMAQHLSTFCFDWAAHGAGLKSSFQILHNRFVIIAVDEGFNAASGCSIDSSVNQIKLLENKFGINFMDRTQVAFIKDEEVFIETLSTIKTKVKEGVISSETKTFNNLVETVADFDSNWVVSAGDTWLKRYF